MKAMFLIVAILIFLIAVVIIYYSEIWIRSNYNKFPLWLRWLIFLPLSILRSMIFSLGSAVYFIWFSSINEHITLLLQWIISPIFFFYTIGITIPKGKKIMPLILSLIWIAGGVFAIISKEEEFVITRIFQILSIAVFMIVWEKLNKNEDNAEQGIGNEPQKSGRS